MTMHGRSWGRRCRRVVRRSAGGGVPRGWSAAVLVLSAALGAAPVNALPADPSADSPRDQDGAFLAALDQAGIRHVSNQQAIGAARNTCQRVRDLFSTAEIADGLEQANPGLAPPHAVAFVTIARAVYCPGVGEGELPGYPGQG